MEKTFKLYVSTVIMCIYFCLSQVDMGNAAVKLNNTSRLIEQGDTMVLKVSGTKLKAKWVSSNPTIASVTKKGKVTAKKPGYATIKAKIKGKTLKCKVTVIDANYAQKNTVESFSLNQTELMLNDNETIKLTANILPSNAIDRNVEWISFNPSVALVDQNGNVTGNNKTSATLSTTIQAKCGYLYADCYVTVKGKNVQNVGTTMPNLGTSGSQSNPSGTNYGNTSSPNTKPDYSWPPNNYPSNGIPSDNVNYSNQINGSVLYTVNFNTNGGDAISPPNC